MITMNKQRVMALIFGLGIGLTSICYSETLIKVLSSTDEGKRFMMELQSSPISYEYVFVPEETSAINNFVLRLNLWILGIRNGKVNPMRARSQLTEVQRGCAGVRPELSAALAERLSLEARSYLVNNLEEYSSRLELFFSDEEYSFPGEVVPEGVPPYFVLKPHINPCILRESILGLEEQLKLFFKNGFSSAYFPRFLSSTIVQAMKLHLTDGFWGIAPSVLITPLGYRIELQYGSAFRKGGPVLKSGGAYRLVGAPGTDDAGKSIAWRVWIDRSDKDSEDYTITPRRVIT